jgi:hypothetical protein
MNEFRDFTSLPPEEEAQFIVYEQRTQFWSKKALRIGVISSAIFGVLMVIIVFSHEKPENLMADDDIGMLGDREDMKKQSQELKGDEGTQPAPTYTPSSEEPAPTPEATTPEATPDPAAGGEAPEAGGAEEAAPAAEPASP